MKKKIFIGAIALLLNTPALFAHAGKTTAVMSELAKYHEALFANAEARIDTTHLVHLLKAGGDSDKATGILTAAIPAAEQLGKATNAKRRLDAYAKLVEHLAPMVGFHDESGTHVFYCPMAKKKWIARGEEVRNPYLPDMRTCGSRRNG